MNLFLLSPFSLPLLLSIVLVASLDKNKNENNIILEKVEFKAVEFDLFKHQYYDFRLKARNVYSYNYTAVLSRPMKTGWWHVVLYYRYNTYTKFLVDRWENFCEFWEGASDSPLAELLVENVNRLGVKTNFEWHCPLSGTITIHHDNLNVSHIVWPLMPAGRYRLDATLAGAKNDKFYAEFQFYFQISDLRIWF